MAVSHDVAIVPLVLVLVVLELVGWHTKMTTDICDKWVHGLKSSTRRQRNLRYGWLFVGGIICD